MSDLAADARTAMNGVVQIHVSGWNDSDQQFLLNPTFLIPNEWTGSGFFFRYKDTTYIVTNAHVVRNSYHLKIYSLLTSEEPFQVEMVGLVANLDPDIALLKFKGDEESRFLNFAGLDSIPYLSIADLSLVRRGEPVKAIGYPLGMTEPNISGGDVTNFVSGGPMNTERLVTDAAINPGNSGGPSVVASGQVIGINTAVVVNANNIGFITPIDYLNILVEQLVENETAELSELGADLQKNSPANGEMLGVGGREGLIVTYVYKNGMLDQAGLRPQDIILSIDGKSFDRHGILLKPSPFHKLNIFDLIHRVPLGTEVEVTFVRDRQVQAVMAKARAFPKITAPSIPLIKKRKWLDVGGMIVQSASIEILSTLNESAWMLDPFLIDSQGLDVPSNIVTYVEPGSEAEELAVEVGDFITHINNQPVNSIDELSKILSKSSEQVQLRTRSGAVAHVSHWDSEVSQHNKDL